MIVPILIILMLFNIIIFVDLGIFKTIIPFLIFFLIGMPTVFRKIVDFLKSSFQAPEIDKTDKQHDNQISHPISSTQLNECEKIFDVDSTISDNLYTQTEVSSSVSQTEVNSSVSRTGVYYDDEDFWVLYKGELIATTISAKEGREYLIDYCKKHNLPL
jgi:hypothetical protein